MGFRRASALWRTKADHGLTRDHRRTIRYVRSFNCSRNRVLIMPINGSRCPTGRFKALALINRVGNRKRTIDRNAIIVPKHDQAI